MKHLAPALYGLLLLAWPAKPADSLRLKEGDRIVFYGDSITDQRLYTVITETYLVTRYPHLHLTFTHSGWGGDRVTGGGGGPIDERLKRDVLPYKPTVVSIMLGMNDGNYRTETEANDRIYFDGMRHIVDALQAGAPGVRITLIEPSPFDDVTRPFTVPGGYNEVLISFSKWLANYAAGKSLDTSDFNRPMTAMLEKANAASHEQALTILPDRVHPSFAGHLVMAEQLLESWGARPTVSKVSIDASGARVNEAEFAHVSALQAANGVVTWTELDDALPLPFAQWEGSGRFGPVGLVLKSSDVTEMLNQQPLQVTGLGSGVYSLKIDGTPIGSFNDSELARGINLAILKTPMTEQAEKVYDLTVSHCDVHNERWRTVQVPLSAYNFPQTAAAMSADDALEQAILDRRQETAQPMPHQFELTPVR